MKRTGTPYDQMDGSKDPGYLARDSGAYGSFPGHDRYGKASYPYAVRAG